MAPLTFKVVYSDEAAETRTLPVEVWKTSNWISETIPSAGRSVTKIIVDPNEDLPDMDPKNNIWTR